MELGNMIFGNSRGNFPIERGVGWETHIHYLIELVCPNDNRYGEEFNNDVFSVFPYYWGDCTCGFDNYEFKELHVGCYQNELEQMEIDAGKVKTGYGFHQWPKEMSFDKYRKIENSIYKTLTDKYNLPIVGCAVHCTCDLDDRYEKWLKEIGYPDECKKDCLTKKPNFVYKPTGFEIQWYKYPLRDSYMNQDITLSEFAEIIKDCIKSLGE